jgi:hypothetical protein
MSNPLSRSNARGGKAPKTPRPKSAHACDSCRNGKHRCEPNAADPEGPCQRCSKVRACVFRPRAVCTCEPCRYARTRCEPDPANVEGPCQRCHEEGCTCVFTPRAETKLKTDSSDKESGQLLSEEVSARKEKEAGRLISPPQTRSPARTEITSLPPLRPV